MARRLVERGVRFVRLFQGGAGNANVDSWDAHADVKSNHSQHAAESDRPIAGLLIDLKARGLLDSTLVIWHIRCSLAAPISRAERFIASPRAM
jgi:hypothetical protein